MMTFNNGTGSSTSKEKPESLTIIMPGETPPPNVGGLRVFLHNPEFPIPLTPKEMNLPWLR